MCHYGQSPVAVTGTDRVRVFFTSRGPPDAAGNFVSRVGYLDLAPDDLTRVIGWSHAPVLELGARGCFDEFGTSPLSLVRTEGALWLYYAGWTRCASVPINASIGVAVSRDGGTTFERLGPGPVLSHALHEPFMVGSPRVRRTGDRWTMHYAAGMRWIAAAPGERPEPVYRLCTATSADGVAWERQRRELLPTTLGPDECQACGEVWDDTDRTHLLFSYRQASRYREAGRGYRFGYAWRPLGGDDSAWRRQDDAVVFQPSGEAWDREGTSYASVLVTGRGTYAFYQGNNMGEAGFGVAVLDPTEGPSCG
jgi:hypothetical protein